MSKRTHVYDHVKNFGRWNESHITISQDGDRYTVFTLAGHGHWSRRFDSLAEAADHARLLGAPVPAGLGR